MTEVTQLAPVTVLMTPVMVVREMLQLGNPLSSLLEQVLSPSHPPSSMVARPSSTSPC